MIKIIYFFLIYLLIKAVWKNFLAPMLVVGGASGPQREDPQRNHQANREQGVPKQDIEAEYTVISEEES
ncbi:MAG: hypothetical protein HOE90_12000 [Bacteriovoracaceae bacterium]|jgi:hypothetical protein|nr:hypothetical protein [Bacteriovoracaceae bacterium]